MKSVRFPWPTVLLFGSIGLVSGAAAVETLTLENETEIETAAAVSDAIDRLSEKVMTCIENNGGGTEGCLCVDECSCEFEDDYMAAKEAYQTAVAAYPHWEDEVVFYQKESDSTGYNLDFEGLKSQFGASCEP
ncbi:MAG: hypothetical protein V3R94_03780 [Acidobacteriota bacterium]